MLSQSSFLELFAALSGNRQNRRFRNKRHRQSSSHSRRTAIEKLEQRLCLSASAWQPYVDSDDFISTIEDLSSNDNAADDWLFQGQADFSLTDDEINALLSLSSLSTDSGSYDTSTILVQLSQNARADELAELFETTAISASAYSFTGLLEINLMNGLDVNEVLDTYRASSSILLAEADMRIQADSLATPTDTYYDLLWGLDNDGQSSGTVDADIDAARAWEITTGSSSVIVAIIDTGVDYNHVDLAANIWTNSGEIAGNGIDDDGNGYIDDIYGYDFANDDSDPMDDQGHGTHVAGTIGAVGDNGIGVAGVAWNVQIMALKFLDSSGSGYTSDAVRALDYAVQNGAQVSNNSWGGGGYSSTLLNAIMRAREEGHIFVAAAGNNSSDNDINPSYPANYSADNIISVAATDRNDQLASFSNFGEMTVHLAAPGVDIASTYLNNQYAYMSGTSMATPHVTGVVALVLSEHPDWTYSQVIDSILDSADSLDSLESKTITGGRLNAAAALESSSSIVQNGSQLDIYGTAQDDLFEFQVTDRFIISMNGTSYEFDLAEISSITFHGDDGYDTIIIQGTAADETATIRIDSTEFLSDTFEVTANEIEVVRVFGNGGYDTAEFFDSPGNDTFVGKTSYSLMYGPGFNHAVVGFDMVKAYAEAGGADIAKLFDSAGDDLFVGKPAYSLLTGDGFCNFVRGFDQVKAYATAGGADEARLYDSAGDDLYIGKPTFSVIVGDGFYNYVRGFDQVKAYATAGGADEARLYDSAGDDLYIGKPTFSVIVGDSFYNYVRGFDKVKTYATAGGEDFARLYDSAGDDLFISTPYSNVLRGDGFFNFTKGFGRVNAYANSGGNDRTRLYDSENNDTFVSTGNSALLRGDGFFNYTSGFETVNAYSTAGGNDVAQFQDLTSLDSFYGRYDLASVTRGLQNTNSMGFGLVSAQVSDGETGSADFDLLDYLFERIGDWIE